MWNYRIIKRQDKNYPDHEYYSLVEVFYNDDGIPCAFADHDEVVGETPQQIIDDLIFMLGDANTEVKKEMYLDQKDFEEGGRYYEASGEWFDKITEGLKDRLDGKAPKGQNPEEARISCDDWFEKFEVESKKDHLNLVHNVVKRFLSAAKEVKLTEEEKAEVIRDIAASTYGWWKDEDEAPDGSFEVLNVDDETQAKMDAVMHSFRPDFNNPAPAPEPKKLEETSAPIKKVKKGGFI